MNDDSNIDKQSWKCTFFTFKNISSMRFCEMYGALNLSQMFETKISQNSQCYKMNNKSLKYDLIWNCQSLNRITNILNDKHIFFKNVQNKDKGKAFLNDYIHIIAKHEDNYELKQIKLELIEKYKYDACNDINNCPYLKV